MTARIFIATPVANDTLAASYHAAHLDLSRHPVSHQLSMKLFTGAGIVTARSEAVDYFLRQTDATHLLFWDSDVCGSVGDALSGMLAEDVACIGTTYPKKHIQWSDVSLGLRSDSARHAESYAHSYAVMTLGVTPYDGRRAEVFGIGAGFLLLRRDLLERMTERFTDLRYDEYHGPDDDREHLVCALFQQAAMTIVRGNRPRRRLLPEDYSFCTRVREVGEKVWLYTGEGAPLDHVGTHTFRGHSDGVHPRTR